MLGASRSAAAPFIVTELDQDTGALLARNPWNATSPIGSPSPISAAARPWTGDRTEFLGRNGTLDHPAALERGARLSGRSGPASIRVRRCRPCSSRPGRPRGDRVLPRPDGQRREARALVRRYRAADPEPCCER